MTVAYHNNVPMLFAKNSNAGEYLDMMLEWMGTKTFINRTAAELIFEHTYWICA